MSTIATTRKQRLRTLEKEIREGMEEFFRTGMKLKEIRENELYKEDGFETWTEFLEELGVSEQFASDAVVMAVTREIVEEVYRRREGRP